MTFEEELSQLSLKCKRFIRSGQISMYSSGLKELADLFHRYHYADDRLKMLCTAFYIDLSGFGRSSYIDRDLINQVCSAIKTNGIDMIEFERLYYSWIQPDMITQHVMGVKDSWYLMRLCVEGKVDQAEYILTKI